METGEVTQPQTKASGLHPLVRGAQARCSSTTLRDALPTELRKGDGPRHTNSERRPSVMPNPPGQKVL